MKQPIYDSADCLIELAAQGLAISSKNNLMRTPIYLAEKKRSKFAYKALVNLEKAIMMSNTFNERKYDKKNEKQLKSALKLKEKVNDASPKKKVRISDQI